MSTIAEELTRIQNAKASLATSIAAKGVAVPAATKIDGYAALVDQISQGGPTEPPMKALCFYDYDGTRLYSFDEDEVAAMTELPALPNHTDMGLVQEGWNWTLADIKTQIQLVGACDVGCTYATSDGKTWVKIKLDDSSRLSPVLHFDLGSANTYRYLIEWGDESEDTTTTPYTSHTYESTGEYIIKISRVSGYGGLGEGFISDGIDYKDDMSIYYRNCVKSIVVCGRTGFSKSCLYGLSLDWLIIGKTCNQNGNAVSSVVYCTAPVFIVPVFNTLQAYLTNSLVSGHNVMKCISINCKQGPGTMWDTNTHIVGGGRIVIPYSDRYSVTGIKGRYEDFYFYSLYASGSSGSCANNYFKKSYKVHCAGASTIAATTFQNNYSLEQIEFHEYDTVPTLANVSAFSGCPDGFKIIVPQSLYAEWKAATNWSTFATYIYYRDSNGDLKQ